MTDKAKILVIGANSFSGQDFVDLLLDQPGYAVIGVSRSPERTPLFLKYKTRKDLSAYRYFQIDMNRQMDDLRRLFDSEQPDYVVNFAAQSEVAPSWEHPEHWFETNTVALAKLINHLRNQRYVKRYLHISSPEVYGTCVGLVKEDARMNPSTPYAASKAAADMLLETYQKQFGFPLVTVRSTNVYGARQQLFKIIPRSVIFIKSGRKIRLHGGGTAVKSYIHIRDISKGELAVMQRGRVGQIYHLSPAGGVAVKDVVRTICRLKGRDFADVAETVAERPGQDAAYVIDSSRARAEFGWNAAIPLETGIQEVIDWVDAYWPEIEKRSLEYQHQA